ncbi:IS3 family transposase [Brevibacillus agri]|uniref:IS3 family transposase n=1 Tax=Brevibacillus agri TaxID=51101 RepID=UPI003D2168C7
MLCAAAGIARSSYYKWLKVGTKQKDGAVCKIISFEHRRLGGIYGYRRMKAILLKKYGLHLNHKRVYRLMKQMNMQAIHTSQTLSTDSIQKTYPGAQSSGSAFSSSSSQSEVGYRHHVFASWK